MEKLIRGWLFLLLTAVFFITLSVVSSTILGPLNGSAFASDQTSLYAKVEETMVNNNSFSNPFTETELRLQVTAPGGRPLGSSFSFFGFYDGDGQGGQNGNVWKFRILFDYPGTWEVQAGFYEPGTDMLNGLNQTFTYEVSNTKISPNEHGHVRVVPDNPRWFRFDDGTPWYPNPTIAHSYLYSPYYKEYADGHLSRGVDVLGVGFRIGNTDHDRYEPAPPWLYSQPAGSGGTPDFTRFNVVNWRSMEERLDYAQENGLKLFVWFGISGLNSQYDQPGPGTISQSNTKLYVKYFLARWAAYTSWWHWTIDSEYEESGDVGRQADYAQYMEEHNPWKTLLTTHVLGDWTPKDNPAFDLATIQKHNVDDAPSFIPSNDYSRPVLNSEGIWLINYYEDLGGDDPDYVRAKSWEHFMAGGHSGYTDSLVAWWADWQTQCADKWGEGICAEWDPEDHPNCVAARGIQSIILANHNFSQTAPANNLATLTDGNSIYCLADPGNLYLIWMDEGGTPRIDLSSQSGTYSVKRYKTADGSLTNMANIDGGDTVTLPSTPATGRGNDWLYVLERLTPEQGRVELIGNISFRTIPLCAMVLANGQYMFTCGENLGVYHLKVPLDQNGEVTLYAFCSGFSPFKIMLSPERPWSYDITMARAAAGSRAIEITMQAESGTINPDWVRIDGTVTYDETPLCAMILANGQHMFSCGDSIGEYELEVPLDTNGAITLYGFCSGFSPYKKILVL